MQILYGDGNTMTLKYMYTLKCFNEYHSTRPWYYFQKNMVVPKNFNLTKSAVVLSFDIQENMK